MRWTRLEELMEFSRRMGFKRLGIASCIGLKKESISLARILESRGFEVEGVFCKVGGVHKERRGLSRDKMLRKEGFEAMCNPVAQARLLNDAGADLNIIMGLCVGMTSYSRRGQGARDDARREGQGAGPQPCSSDIRLGRILPEVYGRKDDKK
jgi:uncharacterized metal-binding protein